MSNSRRKILIAEPRLVDSNFFQTVVLIVEHSLQGASGLILNRPSEVQLSDIWDSVSKSPLGRDEYIHIGGPVSGPLTVLHDQPDWSERKLLDGLHLSMKRENLAPLLSDSSANLRVFTGYSGWNAGQLENEIRSGGWLLWNADPWQVFHDTESVYKKVCEEIGMHTLFGDQRPGVLPDDPRFN